MSIAENLAISAPSGGHLPHSPMAARAWRGLTAARPSRGVLTALTGSTPGVSRTTAAAIDSCTNVRLPVTAHRQENHSLKCRQGASAESRFLHFPLVCTLAPDRPSTSGGGP